jgi:carbamate kinase
MVEDAGRGWRRVVPSPKPVRVLQQDSILSLVMSSTVVIALGGGGIPVVRDDNDDYHGIEAVIDKDLASACLASAIKVDRMIILTGVEAAMLNFGKADQTPISSMTTEQAITYMTHGHFAEGSMKPKIQAALNFLNAVDGEVIITSPNALTDALAGNAGTRITR